MMLYVLGVLGGEVGPLDFYDITVQPLPVRFVLSPSFIGSSVGHNGPNLRPKLTESEYSPET